MAETFFDSNLQYFQLTNKLNFRVLMVINRAAQKVRFPSLILDNEIIMGLPRSGALGEATKTLLNKKTVRFDVTDYITDVSWSSQSTAGKLLDERPVGAAPLTVSLALDNFGNSFNLIPRGTLFILQIRSPIQSNKAAWRNYLSVYSWTKSVDWSGDTSSVTLTCFDRLNWLEMSTGPKDFSSGSQLSSLNGKNVTKIIQLLAEEYKFPLGKVPKISFVPTLKDLKDGTGSVLEFIKYLLLKTMVNEEQKNKRSIAFDIHARDGKINIVPVTKPKKLRVLSDDSLIIDGSLQEDLSPEFATQYLMTQTTQPRNVTQVDSDAGPAPLPAGTSGRTQVHQLVNTSTTSPNSFDITYKPTSTGTVNRFKFPGAAPFKSPVLLKSEPLQPGDSVLLKRGVFGFNSPTIPKSYTGNKTPDSFYFRGTVGPTSLSGSSIVYKGEFIVKTFRVGTSPVFKKLDSNSNTSNSFIDSSLSSVGDVLSESRSLSPRSGSISSKNVGALLPRRAPRPGDALNQGAPIQGVTEIKIPNPVNSLEWKKETITVPVGKSQQVIMFAKPGANPVILEIPSDKRFRTWRKIGITSKGEFIYTFPDLVGVLSSRDSGVRFVAKSDKLLGEHASGNILNTGSVPGKFIITTYKQGNAPTSTSAGSGLSAAGSGAEDIAPAATTKPILINPTSPFPQKAFGIIRVEKDIESWKGSYIDIPALKTPAEINAFAKKILDKSQVPVYSLSVSTKGLLGFWANSYVYIDSVRLGVKGAFLITNANYAVTKGEVNVSLDVKPGLQTLLDVKEINAGRNKFPFLRY